MRNFLYAGVFAAAFTAYAPTAHAQDGNETADARGNEIVVTAQRREQALQDVSIAVTAVGADRLATAQIHNIEDLQLVVPSIYLGNDFNMAKTFIRGVGANTSTTGSETGVAMHVDGVFVARAEAQLTSLFDLQRVEVLRGPQGTLYGRNAVGGSINLITAKPTREWEGYARGTVGNYGAINADAAIGGPIFGDRVLGRIAFSSQLRDGFGENPVTGHDVDDLSRQMARAHLMFELSDDFDILLTGEYYTQEDASRALKFRRESYPGLVRLRALGISPPPGLVRGYATDPRDLASEIDPRTETEAWATTATTNWRLNDVFKLTNITSYRSIDGYILQDLDVSSVVNSLAANGQNSTAQRRDIFSQQFSSELQLTFEADGINGVLGAFYFTENQKPVDTIDADPLVGQPHILPIINNPALGAFAPISATGLQVNGVNVAAAPISLTGALNTCNTFDRQDDVGVPGQTLIPKRVCIASDLQSDAWAVFGQVVFNLGRLSPSLEPFSLKLGGRYSNEEVSAANPSIILARNGLGPIIQTTHLVNTREFESFTPEVGVEWRPTDDILVYYTYSEGFKAGAGQNGAPDANSGWISLIVDPEEIQNHEAGFRSTWADGRLTFNVAAFTYELQGQQINKTLPGGAAGFSTIWQNAAQTSADGLEIEVAAAPTDRFRFNGSVTWLDSKYDNFLTVDPLDPRNVSGGVCAAPDPASSCFVAPNGVSVQLAGNRTRNSPEWSANLHAEVDLFATADGGQVTAMGDVTYRGDVYFTEFQRLLEGQEAYTILDFSVRYVSGADHFTADLWIKNATDELVGSSTFALATARTLGVTYLPPQTYGVTLGYRF
ncbi:MAG: TonB-dependent receptor [Hyphomonadaceae bacterium]|nr:TonB-dependent receptor [Hyphomonadaceae bacterium]